MVQFQLAEPTESWDAHLDDPDPSVDPSFGESMLRGIQGRLLTTHLALSAK